MSDIIQHSASTGSEATTTNTPTSTTTTLLSLPGELRNKIFEFLLVYQFPVDPWMFIHRTPRRDFAPELLRTSRSIMCEASSILYAQNQFEFILATAEDVTSFFEQIGNRNAGSIRHIYIYFPSCEKNRGKVVLGEDTLSILRVIQSYCTNLRTLSTYLYPQCAMDLGLDARDDNYFYVVTEAIRLVQAAFKTLPSVPEMIVDIDEDGPNGRLIDKLRSYGWTVKTFKDQMEEEDKVVVEV